MHQCLSLLHKPKKNHETLLNVPEIEKISLADISDKRCIVHNPTKLIKKLGGPASSFKEKNTIGDLAFQKSAELILKSIGQWNSQQPDWGVNTTYLLLSCPAQQHLCMTAKLWILSAAGLQTEQAPEQKGCQRQEYVDVYWLHHQFEFVFADKSLEKLLYFAIKQHPAPKKIWTGVQRRVCAEENAADPPDPWLT